MQPVRQRHGFSLIEVLVGITVFLLFAAGVWGSIQFVFKVVYQSRIRIIESALLNEQLEIMRNAPFDNIGIIGGVPSGVFARTSTTTRNNTVFEITRTVRNVDDPFDGTIAGTPPDLAPADYKFIEVEAICLSCKQHTPFVLSAIVAPKYLEGDQNTGALFVQVFDASANPVEGASVHIVATSTSPTVDLVDTTDSDGMLRIVGVGAGQSAYTIVVTKDGYTTDGTITASAENPHPQTPPVSVVAQQVTNISFAIDEVSSFALSTLDEICQPIGSVGIDMVGDRVIGTNPDVPRVDIHVTTDANGSYVTSTMPWDTFMLAPVGYDLIGAIPGMPIILPPGTDMPVSLLLGTNTVNSLLVHVRDSVSLQPMSNATVRLQKAGYDVTKVTGVGHVRQTDWSGGPGQASATDLFKYWQDDGNLAVGITPGDITLRAIGEQYATDGYLESSAFDLGVAAQFVELNWEPLSQPASTGEGAVRWQLASSDTPTPEQWEYIGPDGTNGTYYGPGSMAIGSTHDGDQYVRYKLFLHTDDPTVTPVISDVSISYTTACTPPGQVYFGSLSVNDYTMTVSLPGYQIVTETIPVDSDGNVVIDMVPE